MTNTATFNLVLTEAQLSALSGALLVALERYRQHLGEIPTLKIGANAKAALTEVFTKQIGETRLLLDQVGAHHG